MGCRTTPHLPQQRQRVKHAPMLDKGRRAFGNLDAATAAVGKPRHQYGRFDFVRLVPTWSMRRSRKLRHTRCNP